MKRFGLLVLVIACFSLTAFAADVPGGDVFGGFSLGHVPNYTSYGWQGSAAFNVRPMIGVVADFGGQYKNGSNSLQYMFGPRFNARMDKVTYFGEAFFGGDRFGGGGASTNAFSMAYGGGVDVKAGEKLMIRVIQFDWIPVRSGGVWTKNNTRYGFGVVMPFGKK